MTACRQAITALLPLLLVLTPSVVFAQATAQQPRPTFRSAVDVVTIAAVVRDRHGKFARNLKKEDFVVEEAGTRRDIVDFRSDDDAPVRLALLFDVSGSMRLSAKIEDARQAARHVLSGLRLGGGDEAAVFSFDMNLQSLQPFTNDAGAIESALSRVAPYGQTSLYDAIAQTARRVADTRPGDVHRRAVVVLTDGIDTSSELTPDRVSAIASAIDVPVYVIVLLTPGEYEDNAAGTPRADLPEGTLRHLARWTGGELFMTNAPAHESVAARQIIDELRHEYVLAVNATSASGWHPLEVRVKDHGLTVRARSGYAAARRTGIS
jgi:Ca-activated chloride channel homolog